MSIGIFSAAYRQDRALLKEEGKILMDNYEKRQAKSLLKSRDSKRRSVLHVAAGGGDTPLCKFLLETVKFDINVRDIKDYTPLHYAIAAGQNYMTSSFLLNQGANPNSASYAGLTPLHYAALRGRKDQIKLLISKGAQVDAPSYFKGTPLRIAAENGMKDAVKLLLDHKANPNSTCQPIHAPLGIAIVAKSVDCVRLLLKSGADPNLGLQGDKPLIRAVLEKDAEIVKCLLKAGADPNATDFYGFTAIELAARASKVDLVNILFDVTARLPHIPTWSCQGIIEYINSEEAKKERSIIAKSKFAEAKEIATQAFNAKEYLVALYWYTEAITTQPTDETVYLSRSQSWLCLNDVKHALDDAEICVRLNKHWPKGYYQSGIIYKMLQQYNLAKALFKAALDLDPLDQDLLDAYRESIIDEIIPPTNCDKILELADFDPRLF